MLRAVWAGGVRHFDCASPNEVLLVRQMFPGADIHFMHPVKARGAIREAWERHGVRDFVLDSGQDLSIGYLAHDAETVRLYLEESFSFRVLESDAAVALRLVSS